MALLYAQLIVVVQKQVASICIRLLFDIRHQCSCFKTPFARQNWKYEKNWEELGADLKVFGNSSNILMKMPPIFRIHTGVVKLLSYILRN